MGEWKGSWGGEKDYYCKDGRGGKFNSCKSSQSRVSGKISNLSMEKEFIQYLTSIPWRRLCDAQKFRRVYKNIDEWDDSGALESFHTARSRFEALYNKSEITIPPLPDPDMYIEQIDHDLVIDPEIIADIERELEPVETAELARIGFRNSFGTNGWDSIQCAEKSIPVSGWESWGDNEVKEKENEFNNWDKYVEKETYFDNCWEKKGDCWNNENKGWGNNEASCSVAWDKWEDRYNNAWNNSWYNDNRQVWGRNEVSCSSSWEREEYSYNKAWNSNSWDRRNSDWNRRNVRKRDGSMGFRVRKVRFKGEGCNNWRGSRGRNNNPSYPYNIAYS